MSPSVCRSKPPIMRKSVVLPQPDGPSSEKNSPGAMSKVALSTAAKLPKRLLTRCSEIMGFVVMATSKDRRITAGNTAPAQPFGKHHQHDRNHQNERTQRQHVRNLGREAQAAEDEDGQRRLAAGQEEAPADIRRTT